MRFTSTFSALAAFTALAQASPVLDERGTYEQPGVISVGDYYSDTTSTIDMAMPMAGGYQASVTPEAVAANVVPTTASSAAAPSRTQYVVVGGTAGLVYTPEYIFAEIGEVVIFHFGTKNHTFTQSTFPQPCVAMSNGADSGFMPTDGSSTPSFTYTVTTTSPLWFYCKQAKHCESGMVFAINPPTSGEKTFQAYKALAMGGSSTVIATATTSTLVSVTAPPPPPAAYSPPPMIVAGTNIGTDGQCQCVCNIDIANGVVNPSVQGLGVFGGSVGQVAVPWFNMQAAPAPPAGTVMATPAAAAYTTPAADPPATPAASAAATDIGVVSNANTGSTVNALPNVGQGTVIALGGSGNSGTTSTVTDAAVAAAVETGTASVAPSGGFVADGLLGGASG